MIAWYGEQAARPCPRSSGATTMTDDFGSSAHCALRLFRFLDSAHSFGPNMQSKPKNRFHRRTWLAAAGCWAGGLAAGCRFSHAGPPRVDKVWGRRGISPGRLQRPRAIAIDDRQELYIVDITGRIQVFDRDGRLLRYWRTPAIERGKPVGLAIGLGRRLLVADTHYHRLLVYTHRGKLLNSRTIGGTEGTGPGEFGFVTDSVQTSDGCLYVGEYGQNDRIQKFDPEGAVITQWGGHGGGVGRFRRPQSLKLGPDGHLWVADACNHRIQIFDIDYEPARLVSVWGKPGQHPGELQFPYDFAFDGRGHIFVCEFGNQRIQQFTLAGEPVSVWGTPGRAPGQLSRPWGIVVDPSLRFYVLDTYNHRVQRLRL